MAELRGPEARLGCRVRRKGRSPNLKQAHRWQDLGILGRLERTGFPVRQKDQSLCPEEAHREEILGTLVR